MISTSQSDMLSKRGKTNIDVSAFLDSENTLSNATEIAMKNIQKWMKENNLKGELSFNKTKSCASVYKNHKLNVTEEDKGTYSSPDGGYIYLKMKEMKKFPILITEDKKQGSNDKRLANCNFSSSITLKKIKNICVNNNITYNNSMERKDLLNLIMTSDKWDEIKKNQILFRQSTGNAIERFAKNVNFNSLLFTDEEIYPYILFGAGCDFHETETIAGRLRQGNFGRENIRDPKADFSIYKDRGLPTINIFLKSHKWNEELYGSSNWNLQERINICENAMKQSITYYYTKYGNMENKQVKKILLQKKIEELQRQIALL